MIIAKILIRSAKENKELSKRYKDDIDSSKQYFDSIVLMIICSSNSNDTIGYKPSNVPNNCLGLDKITYVLSDLFIDHNRNIIRGNSRGNIIHLKFDILEMDCKDKSVFTKLIDEGIIDIVL